MSHTDSALSEIESVRDPEWYAHDPHLCVTPLSFQKPIKGQLRCTCTRTNCLKKYCVCYAEGEACGPGCWCTGCKNTEPHAKADKEPATAKKHCKCTKTNCLKLYCSCFASGVPCGPSCVCTNCRNTKPRGTETPGPGIGRGRGHGRHLITSRAKKRKRSQPVALGAFLDELGVLSPTGDINELM